MGSQACTMRSSTSSSSSLETGLVLDRHGELREDFRVFELPDAERPGRHGTFSVQAWDVYSK